MPKNSVKQKHWMDFHLDVFSNQWGNHKMTWPMLNPFGSLVALKTLGLVLHKILGITQAAEINWNLKIGTQVNQIMVHMTVSICLMDYGIIMIATTRLFSFVSLFKDHLMHTYQIWCGNKNLILNSNFFWNWCNAMACQSRLNREIQPFVVEGVPKPLIARISKYLCGKLIFEVPDSHLFLGVLRAWMTFKKPEIEKTLGNGLSMSEMDPLNYI